MGRPPANPHGTDRPGMPARLAGTVKMSARYIASGSAVFSPKRNAGEGVVGVATTSQDSRACSKSFIVIDWISLPSRKAPRSQS